VEMVSPAMDSTYKLQCTLRIIATYILPFA
jgi:hypothetical protein